MLREPSKQNCFTTVVCADLAASATGDDAYKNGEGDSSKSSDGRDEHMIVTYKLC